MTEDLIRQLMNAGLSKQQATSVTAETLVQLFMDTDSKALIQEAKRQVSEMQSLVHSLQSDYEELKAKLASLSDSILAVSEAQAEYGDVLDERGKTVLAMYASLLTISKRAGVDPTESVKNAGYIMYAFLGGQARRDITYPSENK